MYILGSNANTRRMYREVTVEASGTCQLVYMHTSSLRCPSIPPQVMVYPSDGVPVIGDPVVAVCGDTSGSCSFSYSAAATPQLFSITVSGMPVVSLCAVCLDSLWVKLLVCVGACSLY